MCYNGSVMECSNSDCLKDAAVRGWCRKHYQRWLKQADPSVLFHNKRLPRLPSEIKEMADIEAAQVGRLIDADGWIGRWGRKNENSWTIRLQATTIPQLADDLDQLTGTENLAHTYRGARIWYISRFRSVLDLARRIAPWSYKARGALPKLEELARYYDS